jgi:ATP/maltotriose-dependent transcriptional regulator MalT
LRKTGLTQREHEVLIKMAEGLSNQEIGGALFLSENTIKTHVSNILFKLNAKRRTQAIQIAKQLKIVV